MSDNDGEARYRVYWGRPGDAGINPLTGRRTIHASTVLEYPPALGSPGFGQFSESYADLGGTVELEVVHVEEIED